MNLPDEKKLSYASKEYLAIDFDLVSLKNMEEKREKNKISITKQFNNIIN